MNSYQRRKARRKAERTAQSFKQSWSQAITGETHPIAELFGTAPVLSDTEWNAFEPFRAVKWIPAVAQQAIGTGGVSVFVGHGADLDPVVFDGKSEYVIPAIVTVAPITDSARLIEAAANIGRAA